VSACKAAVLCVCVCLADIELWQHFRLPTPALAAAIVLCPFALAACCLLPSCLLPSCLSFVHYTNRGKLFAIMRVPSELLLPPFSKAPFSTMPRPLTHTTCNELTTARCRCNNAPVPSPFLLVPLALMIFIATAMTTTATIIATTATTIATIIATTIANSDKCNK